MLIEYIDEHRRRFEVEPICQVLREAGLQIAPSTYYAAETRPLSARAERDPDLIEDIKTVHDDNLGVYGARKIHAELNRAGVEVARCTVERLMRAEGIQGIRRDKTESVGMFVCEGFGAIGAARAAREDESRDEHRYDVDN